MTTSPPGVADVLDRLHTPGARPGWTALDGFFWRRVAQVLARRAPAWFVRWAPPVIGVFIAIASPLARRRTARALERARGSVGPLRGAIDVARTFASFASCLTELLATGSKNEQALLGVIHRNSQVDGLLASKRGFIIATAHTAGWETMGALLAREHDLRVMLVMQRERDASARELTDSARRAGGALDIVHVGTDPLAALPLLRHLRGGGVVAVQIDRLPRGMSGRVVRLLGRRHVIPEGPLRLAQLTGAPIVPIFSARAGHCHYDVHVHGPVTVSRNADDLEVDAAAQRLADSVGEFVSAHPTQWFPFHED